jgi:hypothetical protein
MSTDSRTTGRTRGPNAPAASAAPRTASTASGEAGAHVDRPDGSLLRLVRDEHRAVEAAEKSTADS